MSALGTAIFYHSSHTAHNSQVEVSSFTGLSAATTTGERAGGRGPPTQYYETEAISRAASLPWSC